MSLNSQSFAQAKIVVCSQNLQKLFILSEICRLMYVTFIVQREFSIHVREPLLFQ